MLLVECPNMKGKVFNIQPFSTHDGPGIRTTFFLMGCSLRCRWCHNPEGLMDRIQLQYQNKDCLSCGMCASVCTNGVHHFEKGKHIVDFTKCVLCKKCVKICPTSALSINGQEFTSEELAREGLKDLAFYKNNGGVTFSGGECLLQADFVGECARICKEKGIPTVAIDTAGNVPWDAFEKVLPYADYFLFDIKASSSACHKEGTGVGNARILENLYKLDRTGKKIYIRIPLILELNGNEKEMQGIVEIISKLKNVKEVRVLPYHTFGREKYETLGFAESELFSSVSDEVREHYQKMFE